MNSLENPVVMLRGRALKELRLEFQRNKCVFREKQSTSALSQVEALFAALMRQQKARRSLVNAAIERWVNDEKNLGDQHSHWIRC
jgi:hypothetical protein